MKKEKEKKKIHPISLKKKESTWRVLAMYKS
jgi:hypothetical protein